MADVAFKEGTASAYSKITPDSHTFYHTTDDDQVYLGSKLLVDEGSEHIKALQVISIYMTGQTSAAFSQVYEGDPKCISGILGVISSDEPIVITDWLFTRSSSHVNMEFTCVISDPTLTASDTTFHTTSIYIVYYDL